MKLTVAGRWGLIGIFEAIGSLVLIAIAPIFLNSNQPLIGFLIWFAVIGMLGGSCFYVSSKLRNAARSRKLFITHFPEYKHLKLQDFLEIAPAQVKENLDVLIAAKDDPDFGNFDLSLFDLLKDLKHK